MTPPERHGLSVQGLHKSFGGDRPIRAVQDLSFEAHRGEVFGLLGPNGAGKTTTLRMVATLLTPDRGQVWLAGHNTATHPAAARAALGFVSPTTGLYGRLTVREMIVHMARIQGVTNPEQRTDALLDRLEATDFAHARCEDLSTGMRQKTSLARALVHEPAVLVLDEPTSGLDVLVARAVRREILAAREAGRCVVLSTHMMDEAERLCDRIAIMHRGTIRATGTLAELLDQTGENSLEDAFVALVEGT
jgi:sodium transport system ATP-binding protein